MKKKLLIVESPNKIAKIESFLDPKEWIVMATIGHIRQNERYGTHYLGVNLETMEPLFRDITKPRDQRETIKELNKAAKKVDEIYLATDPDREGEAISWHVTQVIDDEKIFHRITFNEISKDAVLEAIANPRKLDMNLVWSQLARSNLDQIFGLKLSALARKKANGTTAGRVKSPVMRVIIDREEEIEAFKKDVWYVVEGKVNEDVTLQNVDKDYKVVEYEKEIDASKVVKEATGEFDFKERKTRETSMRKIQPLELSSALAGLYTTYGMSNGIAMKSLQDLYEKGILTYPRTDSKRISSKEFVGTAKKHITKAFGADAYVPVSSKGAGQDAHEAIRPTDITKSASDLKIRKNTNNYKVYDFVWRTTMKAMMKPGKVLSVKEIFENKGHLFAVQRSLISVLGYRAVDGVDVAEEVKTGKFVSPFKSGKLDINVEQKESKPPARYNQASIIKKMKELNIGRPSTYASTTQGLVFYGYLTKDGNLKPTELGRDVNKMLLSKFDDVITHEYTASMEIDLDKIAKGELTREDFLFDFWKEFEPRINDAEETIKVAPPKVVSVCSECGSDMHLKRSRFGKWFAGCSNYPECKNIMNWDEEQQATKEIELPKFTNKTCPNCESNLVIRKRKRDGNEFLACPRFPKCRHGEEIAKDVKQIDVADAFVAE